MNFRNYEQQEIKLLNQEDYMCFELPTEKLIMTFTTPSPESETFV